MKINMNTGGKTTWDLLNIGDWFSEANYERLKLKTANSEYMNVDSGIIYPVGGNISKDCILYRIRINPIDCKKI